APLECPRRPVDVPASPQSAQSRPPEAETWVFLVHGDRTRIKPSSVNVMLVGPVYRHPATGTSVGRSKRTSFRISELVGGRSMTPPYVGLMLWLKFGVQLPMRSYLSPEAGLYPVVI